MASFAIAYDTLPSLPDARDAMIAKKGRDFIDGPLRKLFYEQGVQDKLGVRLLHRHFDMNPNERLVEVRKTSFPIEVDVTEEPVIPWHAGNIVPQVYRSMGSWLVPCEFAWEEGEGADAFDFDDQFARRFGELLEEYGMQDLLGLCRRGPEDESHLSMEVTHGRVNVMVPQESIGAPEHVEAFWAYNEDGLEKAACVVVCYSGANGAHNSMHAN